MCAPRGKNLRNPNRRDVFFYARTSAGGFIAKNDRYRLGPLRRRHPSGSFAIACPISPPVRIFARFSFTKSVAKWRRKKKAGGGGWGPAYFSAGESARQQTARELKIFVARRRKLAAPEARPRTRVPRARRAAPLRRRLARSTAMVRGRGRGGAGGGGEGGRGRGGGGRERAARRGAARRSARRAASSVAAPT